MKEISQTLEYSKEAIEKLNKIESKLKVLGGDAFSDLSNSTLAG